MSLKNPDWCDKDDKNLYNELLGRKKETLTDDEKEFFKYMYYHEECACGLDGDID